MNIKKVEGIVVREIDYSNTSKIITVITKEHGSINLLAKGAKKITSNLRTLTSTFSYAEFQISYKPDKLSTLIAVDLKQNLNNIKSDIGAYSYASYITEIMIQITKQDFNERLYYLFINSLLKINEGYNPKIITNIFELQALSFLGIQPVLDKCIKCAAPAVATFSVEAGGCLCRKCMDTEWVTSAKVLKLIGLLSYVDVGKITKLDIKPEVIEELNMFIDLYFEKYSGLYLKSKKSLKILTTLS